MQSTDRDEFESLLKKLCAGFDVPLGDRFEAYWTGLAKMSLIEFSRCIDYALGEEYAQAHADPKRRAPMPTTGQIWLIRRQLKRAGQSFLLPPKPKPDRNKGPDNLVFFANRLLLSHIADRGGLKSRSDFDPPHGVKNCEASSELAACLRIKGETVREFAGFIRERDEMATQSEFIRIFAARIDRVSKLAKPERWRELIEDPRSAALFPEHMADGISSTGTFDFGDS